MTASNRQLKVLVADDNPVNQRLLVKMLSLLGHTGIVVADGAAVLRCVKQHTFDVVLMDVLMPVMTGVEALTALRSQEPAQSAHLAVIMVTAHCDRVDAFKYQQAGADGLIGKPVMMNDLKVALERVARTS